MKLFLYCRTLSLGKGGTERVVVELANEMTRRGHTVYLAYRALKGKTNIAYPAMPSVGRIPVGYGRAQMDELRALMMQLAPDVFMGFYANPLVFESVYLAHGTDIPFALQECSNPSRVVHTNWVKPHTNQATAAWEREVATAAACRIRLTLPEYKDSFPKYIRQNVRVFPNAFTNGTTSVREKGSGRRYILHIGGYKENKNLMPLLKAFSQIEGDFPNWDILLFSSIPLHSEYYESCVNYTREAGMMGRVHFNGSTDTIEKEYARSSIHVITSLSEGLPNCVCEAMTHSLPSVGYSDCPGTNSLIRHESNGLLVPADSRVDGLADAMRHLMLDDDLRTRLGAQAKEDSAIFEPERVYNSWESFFREASEYKGSSSKLLHEQLTVDKKRTAQSLRALPDIISKYCRLPNMFS